MSYYSKGHRYKPGDDDVDDFDEFDSTPYGGGYDITLTFGRPLPPSDETCYPPTSASSGSFDSDRPNYKSQAQHSSYGGGSNYGRRNDDETTSEYGSGYGRKPEHGSEYGSGHGGHSSGGYGRRSENDEPSSEYGSGYGRRNESNEYGSGVGRKTGYGEDADEGRYGGGRKTYGDSEETDYQKPSYGRRDDDDDDRKPRYGRRNDDDDDHKPMYGRRDDDDDDNARKPRYGRHDDDDQRPMYGRRNDTDDEGYHGRKKYGDDGSDDDRERRNRYQNRSHYDH